MLFKYFENEVSFFGQCRYCAGVVRDHRMGGWHTGLASVMLVVDFTLSSPIRCKLFKNSPCPQERSSIISQKVNALGGGGFFYN